MSGSRRRDPSPLVPLSEHDKLDPELSRALALRLTQAEQQERERIAEVLHDHVQQLLFSLQKHLDRLRGAVALESEEVFTEIESVLEEAISTTRTLTTQLSPPVMKEQDMAVALQWLGFRFHALHGLHVEIRLDEPLPIAEENIRLLLYGIIRELLFNVVKHAGVDSVTIDGGLKEGHVTMRVADGGRGFDPSMMRYEGRGLRRSRERLTLAGGYLEIDSASDGGTRIELSLPLKPPSE